MSADKASDKIKVITVDLDDEECGSDDVPLSLINLLKHRQSLVDGQPVSIQMREDGKTYDITSAIKGLCEVSTIPVHEEPMKQTSCQWLDDLPQAGGGSCYAFAWAQTAKTVTIWLPLPTNTVSKDLRIGLKNAAKARFQFDLPLDVEVDDKLAGTDQSANAGRNIDPLICDELCIVLRPRESLTWRDPVYSGGHSHEDELWRAKLDGSVRGEPALRDWEVERQRGWRLPTEAEAAAEDHTEMVTCDLLKLEFRKAISGANNAIDLSTPEINEYALVSWWPSAFVTLSCRSSFLRPFAPVNFTLSAPTDATTSSVEPIPSIILASAIIDVQCIPERIERQKRHSRVLAEDVDNAHQALKQKVDPQDVAGAVRWYPQKEKDDVDDV